MRVAIKQCTNVFGMLKEAKQMFRELHILRRLTESEHIIKLKDAIAPRGPFGQPFQDLYLVFEWADMDCHKLIHSPQFLTGRHIQSFAYQLLKGVKFLQSANVIHRDLKPANILLTTDCRLKICDFGLSRVVSPDKILIRSKNGGHASASASPHVAAAGGSDAVDALGQVQSTCDAPPNPPLPTMMKRSLSQHVPDLFSYFMFFRAPVLREICFSGATGGDALVPLPRAHSSRGLHERCGYVERRVHHCRAT
jgi:serine/threonine protein kinase